MIVTERLKSARKACNFTQQQVADLIGVDRSTYAYYELGTTTPSLDKLVLIAAVFKTDIDWFIGTDLKKNVWSSPENTLSLKQQIKERQLGELSKDERKLIGLYRLALKNGNDKALIDALCELSGTNNENEQKKE